ncbi:VOC family protein [Methylopila turkensis]|uniref:Glyoxalase-like domain-containing protein n=1 Tax=Methylopila turkensis TaxID=1437816 RepID=A0A9W6N6B7_9HYPH|nr:VOC family protein [Methylopila turkensis]GLK79225.1 hypothetical protein GCM10008174_09660 [Methylopila turkensis]
MAAALDHVVVNVLRGMDEAAALFAGLGFQLTPLGRHSLGSINHLMMTSGGYLELVGVPAEGRQRQEVLDSPFGLNGLVMKSADANETFARLAAAGLEPAPPVAFSRPVEIDGEAREARFRTVKVPDALFPAGRVYFCEHLTPELVWRPEWLSHPNGFVRLDRIEVASLAPERDAASYAAAAGAPPARTAAGWRVELSDFVIDVVPGDRPRFATLDLAFDGLDGIAARARATAGAVWSEPASGDGATLALPSLELVLACRSAR